MRQRIGSRAWYRTREAAQRPRVLIEDDSPALAISDFSLFQQAGFDIAFCSGPGPDQVPCPELHGEPCQVLIGADAVLHGLDPRLGVAASIHRRHPGTPVLVKQRRLADGSVGPVPAGCLPLPPQCSVRGQIEALHQAVAAVSRG